LKLGKRDTCGVGVENNGRIVPRDGGAFVGVGGAFNYSKRAGFTEAVHIPKRSTSNRIASLSYEAIDMYATSHRQSTPRFDSEDYNRAVGGSTEVYGTYYF
jgi:hypothetical protein